VFEEDTTAESTKPVFAGTVTTKLPPLIKISVISMTDGSPVDRDVQDARIDRSPLEVGCIVKVRVIGALIVADEEGEDPKCSQRW